MIPLLKYFFIFLTTIYVYPKLLTSKKSLNFSLVINYLILSFVLALLSLFLVKINVCYSSIILILILLYEHITYAHPLPLSILATIFSYAIANLSFAISSGVILSLLVSVFHMAAYLPNKISTLLIGLLSFVIVLTLFKLKCFKRGMRFLTKLPITYSTLLLALTLFFMIFIGQAISIHSSANKLFTLFCLLILGILLLFWWQHNTTNYYLSKLRKMELESLRQELAEKEEQIKQLTASNEDLARTIHKDNKLIPAMLSAVTDYLAYTGDGTADRTEHGTALAKQLRELDSDRMGLLAKCSHVNGTLPQSDHAAVDAMLSYMEKRAEAEDIAFQVKIHSDFSSKIDTEISEADLTHLLSDLIENALIATKTADCKSILVHLGVLCNTPTVEISDTGNPFAPEVYQDFGLSRHSTHLDNGGSGIGLMDIWQLKKKYAASLHIYEYMPSQNGFSKKICLVFDHKKHYLIRTCRPKELLKGQTRSDLYILPLEESQN